MTFNEFKDEFQVREVLELPNEVSKLPLVSVLVQTYQHESFIKDCIKGILVQKTDFPFEILIGEDGSRDRTREICIELAKEFPDKIRLFLHHRENQIKIMGEATSNFNAFYNFFSARGKYFAFCEGDDVWTDRCKLQKHIDSFKKDPMLVMNYHSYETIDHEGKLINIPNPQMQPQNTIHGGQLMEGNFHPLLSTTCFKKAIEHIPLEMTQVINVDTFLLSILGGYGNAEYIKDIKPTQYRIHKGGVWSLKGKELKFLAKIGTFQNLEDYYKNRNSGLYDVYRKKKLATFKMIIHLYIRSLQPFKTLRYTQKYFRELNLKD